MVGETVANPGATLRGLGIATGDALAEVPSGNGYFALPAARSTDPAPVYALDIDESLLDELARIADRQDIENLVPIQGDARAVAGALPEPVDVVLVANTFHGVPDTTGMVRQTIESLRPGGRLIIVNWHDRPRTETPVAGEPRGPPTALRLSPAETIRAVEESGALRRADKQELPPYHYAVTFER